jgi:hypothetical protein
MDGQSTTQPPFDDPDQWWQPSGELVHPVDQLKQMFNGIAEGFAEAFQPLVNAFAQVGYYNPRQTGKTSAARAAEAEDRARRELEAAFTKMEDDSRVLVGLAETIAEITQGHAAVCKHKVKCRPVPAWARLDESVTQLRRPRLHTR